MKLPIAIASLAFVAQVAQAAEPIAVRVTNGLPQLSQVDGGALAWRYVTVRADASLVRFEARLSDCISAPRVGPGTAAAARLSGCGGAEAALAPAQVSQQLQATVRVPQFIDGAPRLDLAVRNWRTTTRRALSSTSSGRSADLELSRPIGPVKAYAGYTVPIGRIERGDDWRTSYAGVKWSPLPRHAVELSGDWSRQTHVGTLARETTAEYSYAGTGSARWRFFVTRAVDEPTEPWRSGLGLDWSF